MALFRIIVFVYSLLVVCHTSYPPMENPNLFEGDMILTPSQRGNIERNNMYAATKRPWQRVIPYDLFGLKYNPKARQAIEDAIRDFHKHTCLRFIPRTTEREYIRFHYGTGCVHNLCFTEKDCYLKMSMSKFSCASSVGYFTGRINGIALGEHCWKKGIAIHEIMHSLGFHHEQSRPDRDTYINVHMENVQGGNATDNFKKYGYDRINSQGEPYDFSSVMHYKGDAFAKQGTLSITTKDPSKQKLIGQQEKLSEGDIRQIKKLYNCKDQKPMTIPVIPTLDPNCSDKYAHCDRYLNYCKPSSQGALKKWVLANCKKTCKQCAFE